MKNKIPIIIDTDPGHDDALAIILAIKSNFFDIKAITTVAGNSTIENTTRNARYILKLLNREDIPIYSGESKPLKQNLVQAVVHGKSGLEGIDPSNEASLTNNAVEKIISIVKSNPGITIITLGPLTNIAKAILKDSETIKKIKQIVMMGGAIKVPGNKNRVAEFNIFVDPYAADIVFNFPVRKTIIPLDACNNIKLQLEDFEKLKGTNLYEPVIAMMKPYIKNIGENEGVFAALMYDPLTVYYLINPNACISKEYDIRIETKGELTRGMTVAELRNVNKEFNVKVVEKIEEDSFKRDFIRILKKENKKIAIVPCVHGIEPYGLEVVKRLPIPFFIGNPLALERKVVFVESNLNRSFPGKENGTYEEKLAYELTKKLKNFDYVIDLHSSSNDCPIFGIISKPNKEKIEFAKKLGLKRLVIMSQKFEENNALIDWVRYGLSLEVGPHERKENVDEAVELIENFLDNKNKNEKIEIFEIFEIIKKTASNIVIKNFDNIRKGDLIARDENNKQYAEFDFTGVLVDEKSYGDVLCLAARKIN